MIVVVSVARIFRYLAQRTQNAHIGTKAAVYTTAILKYLTAKILELAGNASKDLRVKHITLHHWQPAICGDEELESLVCDAIAGGGVLPFIHKTLTGNIKNASERPGRVSPRSDLFLHINVSPFWSSRSSTQT